MRIYARDTEVKKIDESLAREFLEENHKQGSVSVKTFSLGLFSRGTRDLLGLVQFCRPRTSDKKRKYTSELVRLCFKKDVRVVGGASKLIKSYIRDYKPSDFFTYQVSYGDCSEVYEKSGMTFVSQNSEQKYVVAPNKSVLTAKWNGKEIFTIQYAAKIGPDNLIGTNIGEKFNKNGSRKTNVQLFEDLGWHVETTSGDRVYEWVDPNLTFYTYKITASDSEKYYYGVSHVKKANASVEDCLNDGYYGSGGHQKNNKFNNWKRKHLSHIKKEVIEIFERKSEAFLSEKELIGDRWKTDPLCLNSREGGIVSIYKSSFSSSFSKKNCPVHGEVLHRGDTCCTCVSQKSISVRICPIHGETKFSGDNCRSCMIESLISLRECSVHGKVKHYGGSCCSCAATSAVSIRECPIHGEVKHQGEVCNSCLYDSVRDYRECPDHGLSFFVKDSCLKCSMRKVYSNKVCEIHGETVFHKDNCVKCFNGRSISEKVCPIHGLTSFQGDSCRACVNSRNVSKKECSIHGTVKFIGKTCYLCRKKGTVTGNCTTHGETLFYRNGECCKCSSRKKLVKSKICQECGKVFQPTNNRQKYCTDKHYRDCSMCGNPFEWHPKKNDVCSMSCAILLSNKRKTEAKSATSL